MVDVKNIKAISCFNLTEFKNILTETVDFKANDDLNYCTKAPCFYNTLETDISQTILNIPWKETKPSQLFMKTVKVFDNSKDIVQIIPIDGEWRRRKISNSLKTWWGRMDKHRRCN